MLLNMHIKNIALIDEIDISFEEHLNILTGETGAGKSIIIGSLGICLGGKFSKELLRNPEEDGLVELIFSIDSDKLVKELQSLEVDITEDNEVLISRRLSSSGRTINRINDSTVTTAKLKEVAAVLIDLHAQHEQQTLLKAAKHLEILDRFGGNDIAHIKLQVNDLYKEYIELGNKLNERTMDESERIRRMDFLKYQINEIETSNLKLGEDEELEIQYKKCVNSKEILSLAGEIYELTGDGTGRSCSDYLGHAINSMKRIVDLDSDFSDMYNMLQDIDGMVNDFNRDLKGYMSDMEFDGNEFVQIEERLDTINFMKSKYGNSIEIILQACESFKQEYEELVSYEESMDELKKEYEDVCSRLDKKSNELSDVRKKVSVRLCELIKKSLEELNFMSVEFEMNITKIDKFSANGNDEAIFMISTNVGEKMRPLYEVASGGELSRVMLAIKSSLAFEDDTPSLVFDEIDVGISGRTAQSVAEKISIIGNTHQVICITHLPQIASMADAHYIIEKKVEDNKTISNIRKLSSDEEIDEIARLLGGAIITDTTISSAKEMKELAKKQKKY